MEPFPMTRRDLLIGAGVGLGAMAANLWAAQPGQPTKGPRMKTAVLDDRSPKTYLLVFEPGEEVMKGCSPSRRRSG
jgi:hypothetical protein